MENGEKVISIISEIREKSNRLIVEGLKKNNIEGLAPSHGAILVQLYRNDDLCMKDIAERIGKDKSTITALVNKLVKLGYIYKIKDSEDSRITHLKLTGKGHGIESAFHSISEDLLTRIYRGFDENEKKQLISQLNRLSENI